MSRRAVATTALVILALGTTGCSSVSKPDHSFAGPLSSAHVSRGQSFTIVFTVNGSIGFDWVLRPSPGGHELAFDGATSKQDNPNLIGGGGQKIFRFQALRKGTATLRFAQYFRGKLKQLRPVVVTVG